MAVPKRVADRINLQLKKYQSIITDAKNRDVNESDTVAIISDMLADIFGYKKYVEITSEQLIRGTYVDLLVKVDDQERFLVEAKAVGISLKDQHVKQAMEYGAHKGIEWVVLTNGAIWRLYKIHFTKPIDQTLVFEIDLLQQGVKLTQFAEYLSILTREVFNQNSMTAFYLQKQITSKYSLAAMLLSTPMITALKKELKKMDSKVRVEDMFLKDVLANDIIKRELLDSEEGKQAAEFLRKFERAALRAKAKKDNSASKQ